jgi:hypothetical protein
MPKASPRSEDYLHLCADRHVELTSKLSGKAQDSDVVEKAVAKVRSRGALTYEIVRTIIESTHFAAGRQFWTWPPEKEIEEGLAGQPFDLWHLPKNEVEILKRLRVVFRTFEAVSVILRFVVPKEYGILSSPVEHVLGIQPAAASIDRYLNYVRDLREIRDKRKFERAAQVDQALYTLQLGVLGGRLDNVEALKKAHESDKLLRSIKVKNLADGLFGSMPRIDLAEALAGHRLDLAGQLISFEFERAVRAYARVTDSTLDLKAIIDQAAPAHMHAEWHRSRNLRNRGVHGRPLNEREVGELVTCTRRILSLSELVDGGASARA